MTGQVLGSFHARRQRGRRQDRVHGPPGSQQLALRPKALRPEVAGTAGAREACPLRVSLCLTGSSDPEADTKSSLPESQRRGLKKEQEGWGEVTCLAVFHHG